MLSSGQIKPGDNFIALFSQILKTVHFYLVLNTSLRLQHQNAPLMLIK
jgi:hypothetical protein